MAAQATGIGYGPVSLPLKDSLKDKGFHHSLERIRTHIACTSRYVSITRVPLSTTSQPHISDATLHSLFMTSYLWQHTTDYGLSNHREFSQLWGLTRSHQGAASLASPEPLSVSEMLICFPRAVLARAWVQQSYEIRAHLHGFIFRFLSLLPL